MRRVSAIRYLQSKRKRLGKALNREGKLNAWQVGVKREEREVRSTEHGRARLESQTPLLLQRRRA